MYVINHELQVFVRNISHYQDTLEKTQFEITQDSFINQWSVVQMPLPGVLTSLSRQKNKQSACISYLICVMLCCFVLVHLYWRMILNFKHLNQVTATHTPSIFQRYTVFHQILTLRSHMINISNFNCQSSLICYQLMYFEGRLKTWLPFNVVTLPYSKDRGTPNEKL